MTRGSEGRIRWGAFRSAEHLKTRELDINRRMEKFCHFDFYADLSPIRDIIAP